MLTDAYIKLFRKVCYDNICISIKFCWFWRFYISNDVNTIVKSLLCQKCFKIKIIVSNFGFIGLYEIDFIHCLKFTTSSPVEIPYLIQSNSFKWKAVNSTFNIVKQLTNSRSLHQNSAPAAIKSLEFSRCLVSSSLFLLYSNYYFCFVLNKFCDVLQKR